MGTAGVSGQHTEQNQRLNQSATDLLRKLKLFCTGRLLSNQSLDALDQIAKDHRAWARLHGIPFPRMSIVVIPRLGIIEIWRADLERADLEHHVVRMVRKFPRLLMPELADAIARSYPDFKPKSLSN